MLEEKDLQTLLRLKRHEQPPPGYFEDFLQEFHARQRGEMLRQSLWQVALERFGAFMGQFSWSQVSYAGAAAAVLLAAGTASWGILKSEPGSPETQAIASADVAAGSESTSVRPTGTALLLDDALLGQMDRMASASARPHYVMDARPVSYEPPMSF